MTSPVFELEQLALSSPSGRLLKPLSLALRDRAVTVLMGPAGSGKSLLLRALAELPLPDEILRTGVVRFEGCPVREAETRGALAHFPQRRAGEAASFTLGAIVEHGARVVLLDEPDRALDACERERLVRALRARSQRGAVVLVTHDLSFAREVADDVVLLCAGDVVAAGPAPTFFDEPPNELARRFVLQGNCWPAPTPPALPSHFRWLLPEQLAGMGRPGVVGDVDDDLAGIGLAAGITLLVSLTKEPFPPAKLAAFGIAAQHVPIEDMGVPSFGRMASLCRTIERALARGDRVAVHCHAGLGRTGTVLASYLVWRGASGEEALSRVRAVRGDYVQSRDQERFIAAFASSMG